MATVSDRKLPKDNDADDLVDYYKADVLTASNYYPLRIELPMVIIRGFRWVVTFTRWK